MTWHNAEPVAPAPDSAAGDFVQEATLPNEFAAALAKELTLATRDDHRRCVPSRELVPAGRTETWRQRAGVSSPVLP